MRRYMYLMAILLISSMIARADETITVSATNSDIAANLDLKIVAKLFGEAKDLEDFENRLNNPDSAFVNLDLNGDGDVDYIRVIETTNGNKHLIVLQAVLAKDIYQDVASIYVEKDDDNNVSVQVIGDEYIYGENYIIEPVYIYRPVIYDWFWGPTWVCWYSPWYWGYWPGWWHPWACWDYYAYWDHCYHFHHHHHGCSFHYAKSARPAARTMGSDMHRHDYATANPNRSFSERNNGMTNARELRTTSTRTAASVSTVRGDNRGEADRARSITTTRTVTPSGASSTTVISNRSAGSNRTSTSTTSTRSTSQSSNRPSSVTTTRSSGSVSGQTASRPSTSTSASSRPTSSSSSRPSGSSSSSSSRPSSSSSSRPSGSFSGGTHSAPSGGGGGSRGGGGASPRR